MIIRNESTADIRRIRDVITAAFLNAPHRSGAEAAIVDALREAGALTISLVAEDGGALVGHVAFSPVTIGNASAWFGLGPVSVDPRYQGRGIAQRLIREGHAGHHIGHPPGANGTMTRMGCEGNASTD